MDRKITFMVLIILIGIAVFSVIQIEKKAGYEWFFDHAIEATVTDDGTTVEVGDQKFVEATAFAYRSIDFPKNDFVGFAVREKTYDFYYRLYESEYPMYMLEYIKLSGHEHGMRLKEGEDYIFYIKDVEKYNLYKQQLESVKRYRIIAVGCFIVVGLLLYKLSIKKESSEEPIVDFAQK